MRLRHAIAALTVALAAHTAAASPAYAQIEPRFSVTVGYVFFHEQGPGGLDPSTYPFGWAVTGGWRLGSSRLTAVGEFDSSTRLNTFDETQQVRAFLGGARFAIVLTQRTRWFVQGLAGLERFSEPGFAEWGPSVQAGGGVDIRMWPLVFLRAQSDYRWSVQSASTFHGIRAFIGIGIGR